MEVRYYSQVGCIVKMCPGLPEYWYHQWKLGRGSAISGPNPECAPTEDDWALCAELLAEFKAGRGIPQDAPYDQQVFEDMIFDYIGDHAFDEDWPGEEGEYPETITESIEYDADQGVWVAYGRFADGKICEFFGNVEGYVHMETEE